ncbi:MAG TPA: type III-B CRISPR module RAMP protein Cmr1 [Acidobacteriota bacterium]|nr:type III-B CRISPR module RAMP protein Cmr1 [Acidobacteriota bacterium]
MRPAPTATLPPVKRKETPDSICQTRSYQLITPLYGGGVEPAKCDEVTVVRATEIRGHLRFWWRATQGGRFDGNLEKMKAAEGALWGSAGGEGDIQPSKVQVVVIASAKGNLDNPFEVVRGATGNPKIQAHSRTEVPSYVAFPLQPKQEEAVIGMTTESVQKNVTFTVKIVFPTKSQPEIEAALWAWETFGGLGARTRRGFGAVHLVKIDDQIVKLQPSNQVLPALKREIEQHVVNGTWPKNVPFLAKSTASNQIQITSPQPTPVKAWELLIRKLKLFRQQRNPGSRPNMPGRSHWPEPDEIRRLTRRSDPNHRNPLWNVSKFPRAVFGLPIIFHFKDRSEPGDTSLQGTVSDRFGSPLILRPLVCADGKAVGLACVLSGPREPDGGLILKGAPGDPSVNSTLSPAEAARLKPLNGQADVLQAFLKFLIQ